jgi:hypothetical protein
MNGAIEAKRNSPPLCSRGTPDSGTFDFFQAQQRPLVFINPNFPGPFEQLVALPEQPSLTNWAIQPKLKVHRYADRKPDS